MASLSDENMTDENMTDENMTDENMPDENIMLNIYPEQFNDLPKLPRDDAGPVFQKPWQAQVFALAVSLCESGYFSWSEWVESFSKQIKQAQQEGDPDLGDSYYNHWLNNLESMVSLKNIVLTQELLNLKEAWRKAYLRTPHGMPIELFPSGEADD